MEQLCDCDWPDLPESEAPLFVARRRLPHRYPEPRPAERPRVLARADVHGAQPLAQVLVALQHVRPVDPGGSGRGGRVGAPGEAGRANCLLLFTHTGNRRTFLN